MNCDFVILSQKKDFDKKKLILGLKLYLEIKIQNSILALLTKRLIRFDPKLELKPGPDVLGVIQKETDSFQMKAMACSVRFEMSD